MHTERPRTALCSFLAVLSLVAGLSLPATISAAVVQLDRIVAVVEDDVITTRELAEKTEIMLAQLRQAKVPIPPDDVLTRQVLERLVIDKLQLQLAQQTGVQVDDAMLDQTMETLARNNGVTLSQFRQVLERDGFDYENFRENIRAEMVISRLRQRQVEDRVEVTPAEIDNYLVNEVGAGGQTEYHLAHILVAVPEAASPETVRAAERKALDAVRRAREGADFGQLAVAVSDAQTALEGGDLGWRTGGQLPTLFVEPVATMRAGDISDPIRSASGFHVIKLLGLRGDEQHLVTRTHARHILIKTNELVSQEDARNRLRVLRDRIEAGASFEELARSNSDDIGSAPKGGDLGWVKPGDLVPEFEKVMNDLAPGETSTAFRSRFGWHIVQVLGRRQQDDTDEYRRSRAAEAIRERKIEEETLLWLRRLRDEAYVDYRLEDS